MPHPLDRPIWSALTGPLAHLAHGDARAWRIDPAFGYFAATGAPGDVEPLTGLMRRGEPLIVFEDDEVPPSHGLCVSSDVMVQMVATEIDAPRPGAGIETLGDDDAAEMLALATLTRPGPFLTETHRLGGFVGIREDGQLVAMAGTRLRVPGHVEVSAVCTHPDHRGHGHAARLMQSVGRAIIAEGDVPFLHAFASNVQAVALYERLGFRIRRRLVVSFLTASPA